MASIGIKLFRALVWPFQRLPMGFHRFCGNVFAFVAEHIMHYRRDVVMVNVARSFPDRKYKEIGEIVHGFYRHIGDIFAETMWYGGCRGNVERLHRQQLCTLKGAEALADVYNEGRSSMVLMSHSGNWEIVGGMFEFLPEGVKMPFTDEDFVVVYKRLTSKVSDDMFRRNRTAVLSEGYKGYTESRELLRFAITNRNNPKVYFIPTDQFPYKFAQRHQVPDFMHQPTLAMTGGASMACKFGMPVFYLANDRIARNRYELRLIKICDNASEMTPEEVMTRFYALLEVDVDNNPTNYLWSHKRWK